MDREFKVLEWDGFHFGAVLTYWTQPNTVAGTVWRFVMDGGKTLVVVPYQSPNAPAPEVHLVPRRIVPLLAGGEFEWAVRQVATANLNAGSGFHDDHYEWDLHRTPLEELLEVEFEEWKPALKEYAAWYETQNFKKHSEFEESKRQWWHEREKRWKEAGLSNEDLEAEQNKLRTAKENPDIEEQKLKAVFDKWRSARTKIRLELGKPRQPEGYEQEQNKIDARRQRIEKKYLARIEKAKATRAAEIEVEALQELREMLAGYGAKTRGTKWLKTLYDFIRDDVCNGKRKNPSIGDAALRRMLAKVQELTGKDIAEQVAEASRFVKGEMFSEAARQNILERVRFMAEFPDGKKHLVESIESCIHCGRDAELFELVKPTEQEREGIGRKVEEARTEAGDFRDVVEFSDEFKHIRIRSATGTIFHDVTLGQARNTDAALRYLYEHRVDGWLIWSDVVRAAGSPAWTDKRNPSRYFTSAHPGKKKDCIECFVVDGGNSKGRKVRLNPDFHYKIT